jgi:hypothetical protein
MTASKPKSERPVRPRCTGCNHSDSFHRQGHCMVMGCTCQEWNGPHVLTKHEREEAATPPA